MSLIRCVKNDVYGEGTKGNCRWMYSTTDNERAPGILSLAVASNFDRWANSRVVEVHTALWDEDDGDLYEFINRLVGAV